MHRAVLPNPLGATLKLARATDANEAPWESQVDDAVCSTVVTPDNSIVAVGSEGGEILLRQLGPGCEREQRLAGHAGGTMALSWVAPRSKVLRV